MRIEVGVGSDYDHQLPMMMKTIFDGDTVQISTKMINQAVVKMSSRGLKMMIFVQWATVVMMLMMLVIALLGPEGDNEAC